MFESSDDVRGMININSMTIIVKAVFKDGALYYPQVCLNYCAYGIKMSKTKELSIDSTLWVDALEIVDLKDVVLSKLNVKSEEYDDKYDLTDYVIEYNGGGFWLAISNLKGYFSFNNGTGYLELLFESNEQETMYDKVWKKIVHTIGRSGLVKDNKKVRLHSNDLPVNREFLINKLIIVVKSVVEWSGAFYPQISLNYCSYDV